MNSLCDEVLEVVVHDPLVSVLFGVSLLEALLSFAAEGLELESEETRFGDDSSLLDPWLASELLVDFSEDVEFVMFKDRSQCRIALLMLLKSSLSSSTTLSIFFEISLSFCSILSISKPFVFFIVNRVVIYGNKL